MSGVTKRTIDHYTRIGLLKAVRSASNYRYYSYDTIDLIKEIETRKQAGMTLQEIARNLKIEQAQYEEVDLQLIRLHMQTLEQEVKLLAEQLEKNPSYSSAIKQNVSPQSVALMQSLLLIIN